MSVGGTAGAQQSFKFQGGDHIVNAAVAILWDYRWIEDVVPGGQNDRTHLQIDKLILLLVINSACLTDLGANAALFALTQLAAIFGINAVG